MSLYLYNTLPPILFATIFPVLVYSLRVARVIRNSFAVSSRVCSWSMGFVEEGDCTDLLLIISSICPIFLKSMLRPSGTCSNEVIFIVSILRCKCFVGLHDAKFGLFLLDCIFMVPYGTYHKFMFCFVWQWPKRN